MYSIPRCYRCYMLQNIQARATCPAAAIPQWAMGAHAPLKPKPKRKCANRSAPPTLGRDCEPRLLSFTSRTTPGVKPTPTTTPQPPNQSPTHPSSTTRAHDTPMSTQLSQLPTTTNNDASASSPRVSPPPPPRLCLCFLLLYEIFLLNHTHHTPPARGCVGFASARLIPM